MGKIVTLHGATVSEISKHLVPGVPWIWIDSHMVFPVSRWFKQDVPLDGGTQRFNGLVRGVCYDLLMPTSEFLELAPSFDEFGIDLVQSENKMPDTLQFGRIRALDLDEQIRILERNGAVMRAQLPHKGETAVVSYLNNCGTEN